MNDDHVVAKADNRLPPKAIARLAMVAGGLVAVTVLCQLIRPWLGSDVSGEAIQEWIGEFGWKAPVLYLAIVVFRHFLFLPATIVLIAGGLCFGAVWGGLLGTLGTILTGLLYFFLARFVFSKRTLERRPGLMLRIVQRSTPTVVFLATAAPTFPMSAVHAAAGFSEMPAFRFAVMLSLGAAARSFLLAYFGSAILSNRIWHLVITVALVSVVVLVACLLPQRSSLPPNTDTRSDRRV